MRKTYFGFAIADSMFPTGNSITKIAVSPIGSKREIEKAINCCNISHRATIEAMHSRLGLELQIPDEPPRIELNEGDSFIVASVRGLPRLTDNRHYTEKEIDEARFIFSKYVIGTLVEDGGEVIFQPDRAWEYTRIWELLKECKSEVDGLLGLVSGFEKAKLEDQFIIRRAIVLIKDCVDRIYADLPHSDRIRRDL